MNYLESFSNQLSSTFGGAIPNIIAAILVLLIGLFLAGLVSRIAKSAFGRTQIDERIARSMNLSFNLGDFLAKIIYYLAVMFVLLLVLNMMGIESVLDPLKNMLNEFVGFIPNILAAGIIGFVGYVVAKLASEGVGFISTGIENYSERMGFHSPVQLTKFLKQVVFIIVFFPILIQALASLNMRAISEPATQMLAQFLNAIPSIIAAGIILGVFYFVGRYIIGMLKDLLRSMGTDEMAGKIGIQSLLGNHSLSNVIGNIAFFFLMFTGIIAAVGKLDMGSVGNILDELFHISGKVFFGVVILLAGAFVANLAARAVNDSDSGNWMASIVRFAVMGIFLAFALHTMGIAQSIVNLAFGLTLGAIAVAFALAFGLGGRDAAGKQMDHFFESVRKKK